MFNWIKKVRDRGRFAALDEADFPVFERGTVWLVGAGPGGPGLLTLLGYHALGQADVIVHDALVSPALLALAPKSAKLLFAGKRGGKPSPKQADISLAREGIKFRIVPGISSGLGGLAYAGIPITHRDTNQAVMFLTGHDDTGAVPQGVDWPAVATAAPVIVMYMAVKHLASIADKLLAAGRNGDDQVTIVSHIATPQQSLIATTLAEAGKLTEVPTPAIVILGPVGAYRETLDWYVEHVRSHVFG